MSYIKQVKAFLKSHQSANIKALALVHTGAQHMLEHRDWDGLAMLVAQTEGKLSVQIRAILGEVIGGLTIAKDKAHHTGYRFTIGDNFGPTEKLALLGDLVEAGESIFGDKVKEGLLGKAKVEAAPKSLDDCREHISKYLAKHGFTLADVVASTDPLALGGEPAHCWNRWAM